MLITFDGGSHAGYLRNVPTFPGIHPDATLEAKHPSWDWLGTLLEQGSM